MNVPAGTAREVSYDLNGNMLSDGEKSYAWDAANRLVKITMSANIHEFVYNGAGQRVEEKLNGATTKRFIWCGVDLREERDAGGLTVVKRFFGGGVQLAGANYYYTRDHLGSVRELTDSAGALRARYDYDPWGRRAKISGDMEADFGFTGHYIHPASGLHLAFYRAYDAELGRWLSRDPLENAEMLPEGPNIYAYVSNNPSNWVDYQGLKSWAGEGVISVDPDCTKEGLTKLGYLPEEGAPIRLPLSPGESVNADFIYWGGWGLKLRDTTSVWVECDCEGNVTKLKWFNWLKPFAPDIPWEPGKPRPPQIPDSWPAP